MVRWGIVGEEFHEDAASVIDEITKTLGHEDSVDVAWCGLLEFKKVVVRDGL